MTKKRSFVVRKINENKHPENGIKRKKEVKKVKKR